MVDKIGDDFDVGMDSGHFGALIDGLVGPGWLERVFAVIEGDNEPVFKETKEEVVFIALGNVLNFNDKGWV